MLLALSFYAFFKEGGGFLTGFYCVADVKTVGK
jgi:hypothetical protein